MSETRLTSGTSYVSSSGSVFKVVTEQDGSIILYYREAAGGPLQTVNMVVPEAQMLIALVERELSITKLQQHLQTRVQN